MAHARRIDESPEQHPDHSITELLTELSGGNRKVEAELIPQIYDELRRVAGRYMRFERPNHTLQPTALVNEAYVRLIQEPNLHWKDRAHFFATAAQLMRHILVDHARARRAGKRGGVQNQITLNEDVVASPGEGVDVLALHEALEKLAAVNPRQGRIVELHFFGGMAFEEIAAVLDVSERTVKRDWAMARIWLFKEISG